MSALAEKIAARIRAEGPIAVADYMAMALDDPEHGYYRTRAAIGADFTTAPETTQAFGEILGLWAAVTWQAAGAPDPVRLVELGPGRGTLMADALRAAVRVPAFMRAVALHLVEVNPVLHAAQESALASHLPTWHARFADVPAGPLLLIANEFFDALPVHQRVRTEKGWRERRVGLAPEGGFRIEIGPPAPPPRGAACAAAASGDIVESRPAAEALSGAIARRIRDFGGAALIIDYGPARSAPGDSLQAVHRHRFCDPLAEPGTADLTAHVDFQALAESARAAGVKVHGPVAQGRFLAALGIEARTAALAAAADDGQAILLRSACRRLIDPLAMGTLFKALAITRTGAPAPAGFEGEGEC